MLSDNEKAKLANRLSRIAGQISGLQRLIDEDAYCVDILVQIAAANGALSRVGHIILQNHLQSCVTNAMKGGNAKDRQEKLEELIMIFGKYARIAK